MYFYSFVCVCLVLGQTILVSCKNIATTDNPTETTTTIPSEHHELLNLQSKLLKIQDDIISITAGMGIATSLANITHKIDDTVKEFQLIKEELASDRLEQQINECNKDAETMFNNLLEAVDTQIKYLQSNFEANKEKRLPSDIVADLKAMQFEAAEKKIREITDRNLIVTIFQDVHDNCSLNFEVLVKFVESLANDDDGIIIHFCVKVLQSEMLRHHHRDPYHWMRLAKKLQEAILDPPNVDYFAKKFTSFTSDSLKDSIKLFTLESLNNSLSKGKFERNGELENLTSAVFLFDPEQSKEIIKEFVNSNYGKWSSKKLLEIVKSHKSIQQRAEGVSALFWNIQRDHNLNSDVTLKIASTLHDIRSDSDGFVTLNKTQQEEVNKLIDNLPVCARNLFFLPSVCFWNRETEEYLTAGSLSYKHDNQRRNIFTTDQSPDSHWYVNMTGDNFLLSSRSFANEYMYAAVFNFNQDLRYVFNWIPGNNTDVQSNWSIELIGDYCYVKSAAYNEYLFSSNQMRDSWRKVFTWVAGYSVYKENKFQWQVRNCD